MYTDSHIHLYDIFTSSGIAPCLGADTMVCASAHAPDEFVWQENFARAHPGQVYLSYGIHPQEPSNENVEFIESLVCGKRIQAIGECGFDLFTEGFRATLDEQKKAWDFQLDLAVNQHLPLVVHCRKALNLLFADTKRLKKLKAIVFHGWPGSCREAESFLDRGVEAWFSAGKGLLRGDRSLMETVSGIPIARILTETDAPYMTLKGEEFSVPDDIRAVTAKAAFLAGMEIADFCRTVDENFRSVFSAGCGS